MKKLLESLRTRPVLGAAAKAPLNEALGTGGVPAELSARALPMAAKVEGAYKRQATEDEEAKRLSEEGLEEMNRDDKAAIVRDLYKGFKGDVNDKAEIEAYLRGPVTAVAREERISAMLLKMAVKAAINGLGPEELYDSYNSEAAAGDLDEVSLPFHSRTGKAIRGSDFETTVNVLVNSYEGERGDAEAIAAHLDANVEKAIRDNMPVGRSRKTPSAADIRAVRRHVMYELGIDPDGAFSGEVKGGKSTKPRIADANKLYNAFNRVDIHDEDEVKAYLEGPVVAYAKKHGINVGKLQKMVKRAVDQGGYFESFEEFLKDFLGLEEGFDLERSLDKTDMVKVKLPNGRSDHLNKSKAEELVDAGKLKMTGPKTAVYVGKLGEAYGSAKRCNETVCERIRACTSEGAMKQLTEMAAGVYAEALNKDETLPAALMANYIADQVQAEMQMFESKDLEEGVADRLVGIAKGDPKPEEAKALILKKFGGEIKKLKQAYAKYKALEDNGKIKPDSDEGKKLWQAYTSGVAALNQRIEDRLGFTSSPFGGKVGLQQFIQSEEVDLEEEMDDLVPGGIPETDLEDYEDDKQYR